MGARDRVEQDGRGRGQQSLRALPGRKTRTDPRVQSQRRPPHAEGLRADGRELWTMMHCPNCGKPADAAQQFCRACGMSLDTVGQLVAQHSSSTPVPRQNKAELERQIVRTMFRWITWGMILLGIGVLMIVFNKSFNVGGWLKFMASAVSLA